MMQSAIATLGDGYHTSASTCAHKNNYFNIVYALHSPSNMWQVKVFADSSSSSSGLDFTELPHLKRNTLPHHVLHAGAIKQQRHTLASFNTNHRVFCYFGGINLKRCFTVIYRLNLVQCVCTGYI